MSNAYAGVLLFVLSAPPSLPSAKGRRAQEPTSPVSVARHGFSGRANWGVPTGILPSHLLILRPGSVVDKVGMRWATEPSRPNFEFPGPYPVGIRQRSSLLRVVPAHWALSRGPRVSGYGGKPYPSVDVNGEALCFPALPVGLRTT